MINELTFFIVGVLAGVILTILYEVVWAKLFKEFVVRVKGWHIHHSVYGLLCVIAAFTYSTVILGGIGTGILLRHAWKEKTLAIVGKK